MFKFLEGKTMAMKSTKNGCDGQSSAEHWDAQNDVIDGGIYINWCILFIDYIEQGLEISLHCGKV